MTKEITTSVERTQLKLCEIIGEIVEVERLIRNRPKLREAITRDKRRALNMRHQLLSAKEALNKAVEYIGKCDDRYRASLGLRRPPALNRKDPQGHFDGI